MGQLAWAAPLLLAAAAWRILRHPEHNAPAGRNAIGWAALLLGACGVVHVLAGTPLASEGSAALRSGGGWLGFLAAAPLVAGVTSFLALPAARPARRVRGPRAHRHPRPPGAAARPRAPRPAAPPTRPGRDPTTTSSTSPGRPPSRSGARARAAGWARWRTTSRAAVRLPGARRPCRTTYAGPGTDARPGGRRRRHRRRDARPGRSSRCRPASSSSRCRATSPTTCPPLTCCARARPTRRARRSTTRSSRRSPRCSTSSRSTRRSPASPAARPSPATRSSSARPSRSSG